MTFDKNRLTRQSALCANCGEEIGPNSHVGVMIGRKGERLICHTSLECSPAGNTCYGFWGEGRLVSLFENVEQC